MPDGLRKHVRYSNTMMDVQAKTYQRYHMSDAGVFYQNEDRWSIATNVYGQSEVEMIPNYFIMKLPGGESEEFISMIPFTPYGRKNMTGMLVARSDGDAYGELILYRLPKDRVIYGPMQVESQIDQNTQISQDFSLWNSSGSKYTRGDMFVIPIDNSIMYVEPVYLESDTDTSLPEVKRVIVAYHDQIAYSETLAGALDSLFNLGQEYVSENTAAPVPDSESGGEVTSLSMTELAERANTAFDNAVNAQRNGDWASYGSYLNEVQMYLNQMTGRSTVQTTPAAESDVTASEEVTAEAAQ